MKRIPLLLVALISVLMIVSGSALASARHAAAKPDQHLGRRRSPAPPQRGATLNATSGAWNGATPISYAYQWQRCNSSGSSCGTISGATNQNYVVSNSDSGRTIRAQVTATNADGSNQALSGATGTVVNPGALPANTKQPDPSGKAEDGQNVTVDPGTWSGQKPIAFSYQWQSCNAAGVCTDIAGATSQSFTVTSTQVGSKLRAMITATNSAGKATASSNLTVAVIAKTSGSPVNTTLPLISGSALVGHTKMQSSTGRLDRRLDHSFGYQWSRCNTNGIPLRQHLRRDRTQSYGIGTVDAGNALPCQRHGHELDRLGQCDLARVDDHGDLRPEGQPLRDAPAPARKSPARTAPAWAPRGALHRKADRQHAPVDPDVHTPHRQAEGRRAEQGPARHERRCVQDALPQLLLALARHADADRLTARCARARTGLREHPHDEEPARRDPRPDQPASRRALQARNLLPVRRTRVAPGMRSSAARLGSSPAGSATPRHGLAAGWAPDRFP